ncbi:MAG: hypothetical protein LAT55_03015 [Opitutales bacterium]|nr:hypothetical protein [Opitutales bacterium]
MGKNNKTYFYSDFTASTLTLLKAEDNGERVLIRDIKEINLRDEEATAGAIESITENKRDGYLLSTVGFYPESSFFLYRELEEPKKASDGMFLSKLVASEGKVDPEEYTITVLSNTKGIPIDFSKAPEKEVLFCGAKTSECLDFQNRLLELKVFPRAMEISTLGTVGALLDYLDYEEIEDPALMIELGMDTSHAFILENGKVSQYRLIQQGMRRMFGMVKSELGLKDETAAARLFHSDTFDFQEMGPKLAGGLLREINAYAAFYEVQKGSTIRHVICSSTPGKLPWLNTTLAKMMVVDPIEIEYGDWLAERGIDVEKTSVLEQHTTNLLGSLGLMLDRVYKEKKDEVEEETA